MSSMGHGVGWEDDYPDYGAKYPHMDGIACDLEDAVIRALEADGIRVRWTGE